LDTIISHIIPQQNFEKVGEQIGAILTVELEAQKTNQGFLDDVKVFQERMDPPNTEEELIVNVLYNGTNNADDSQSRTAGTATYYVDVYSTGKASNSTPGDLASNRRCNKFLGMIRYILSFTGYKTLGFLPGFIAGVSLDNIQKMAPETIDASYTTMGRITVSVRMTEGQELETGSVISEILTSVKLELTEQGYQYKQVIL